MRRLVTPREKVAINPAASGALPFGLGRETILPPGSRTEPFAVLQGFKPRNRDHGLLGMSKVWILPEGRRQSSRGPQKMLVVGVGDLSNGEQQHIHPDAVHRSLVVLSAFRAHPEPALRDAAEGGLEFRPIYSRPVVSRCHVLLSRIAHLEQPVMNHEGF